MSYAVAMLSVHTSPLAMPGSAKDAGGMNVYIRELACELGQAPFTIDIFTRRTHPDQPEIIYLTPRVRVIHIEAGPSAPVDKHKLYQYVPVLACQIKAFADCEHKQYDLLHSHYWLSGVVAQQLAHCWHVPHITMFHTLAHLKQLANPDQAESALRLEIERQLIQHCERIIATTVDERAQIMHHCGAPFDQVEVIPCGVDLRLFVEHECSDARTQLGLDPAQPVLLFVGRLDPFKGPDVFLQAAAMMRQQVQLVIVGGNVAGDPEMDYLRQLACDLGLQARVHFLGARPQAELPLIYSAADITVVPSYHESFGMAAVESLACGTPVVATRAGGLMTVVHHNETGYLVPRDPRCFAEHLEYLLDAPATQERMRQAARPSVLQYSWESVADQMRNVYEDVLREIAIGEANSSGACLMMCGK